MQEWLKSRKTIIVIIMSGYNEHSCIHHSCFEADLSGNDVLLINISEFISEIKTPNQDIIITPIKLVIIP